MSEIKDFTNHFLRIQKQNEELKLNFAESTQINDECIRASCRIADRYLETSSPIQFHELHNEIVNLVMSKYHFDSIPLEFSQLRPSVLFSTVNVGFLESTKNGIMEYSNELRQSIHNLSIHTKPIISNDDLFSAYSKVDQLFQSSSIPTIVQAWLIRNLLYSYVNNMELYRLILDSTGTVRTSMRSAPIKNIDVMPPWVTTLPENISNQALGSFVNFWYRIDIEDLNSGGHKLITTLQDLELNNYVALDTAMQGAIISISKGKFVSAIPNL